MVVKHIIAILALVLPLAAWSAEQSAAPVTGKVLEAKEVQSYTYLRLKTKDGEVWAAVGRAPVKVGTDVTIVEPMVMTNFESRALNRKFDRIVLGNLQGQNAPAAPPAAGGGVSPHGASPSAAEVGDVKVAKANGPDARTVSEIITRRTELKDKPVLLRAKIVKYTPDVMGKNWLHLRDGTGSAAEKTHDVLVTTTDRANVGDIVLVKGVVHTDRNLGSGYAYNVLIEEARVQK